MNPRTITATPILLLMAALIAGGCESPTSISESDAAAADFETVLTQELGLNSAQQDGVATEMRRHDGPDVNPGSLWFIAARLQLELDDAQKNRLFLLARGTQGKQLHKLVGVYGPCRISRPTAGRPLHIGIVSDLLSDEQWSRFEEIRRQYQDQIDVLHQQVRNGHLTRQDFDDQLRALHAALSDELLALLTAEQAAALEERIAQRGVDADAFSEGVKQAMIEALGLDEAQAEAVDVLHERQCSSLELLVQQAQSGEITREELRSKTIALIAGKSASLGAILGAAQLEAVKIHDALLLIHARRFLHSMMGPHDGGPRGGGGPGSQQGRHG